MPYGRLLCAAVSGPQCSSHKPSCALSLDSGGSILSKISSVDRTETPATSHHTQTSATSHADTGHVTSHTDTGHVTSGTDIGHVTLQTDAIHVTSHTHTHTHTHIRTKTAAQPTCRVTSVMGRPLSRLVDTEAAVVTPVGAGRYKLGSTPVFPGVIY